METAKFTYIEGNFNVNYLEAPYELLVRAFGNDGSVSPRDPYKSMAEWDVPTEAGVVEIYDYKKGVCYAPDGLQLADIRIWNVQGRPQAIAVILHQLAEAAGELESGT